MDITELLHRYPAERRYMLAVLQDIQERYQFLPKEALCQTSGYFGVPLSKLYGMATFYKAFSLKAKGKNIIRVCDGTACHIRSSTVLLEEIERLLHLKPGDTSVDGVFSLETVSCLGSCALAPVLVVNEEYYGSVTRTMVGEILNHYGPAMGEVPVWDVGSAFEENLEGNGGSAIGDRLAWDGGNADEWA
ncbi:NAD(P)H-dependent oxidoreductase subunit E [Anoxybacterium hadale]|uniref:NAD(P)H-dependent oxidoreductase subunit E n=2 Tax=Anoxybacterium hadale TaxID=3408580 RepID=A0ACD1AGU4_9FIRM|nr:NAD(P)H-dependent oxidoreductase subunit E [Clostridiales bacterium]